MCFSWIIRWLAAVAGLGFAMASAMPEGAVQMRLIGQPEISADGKFLAFEWSGDLWISPATGGEARRLTDHPSRETDPLFTPDGKGLVFCSNRTGSLQIFSMPVEGGEAIQHTFHSEGNQLECLSPDGKRAVVRGARERSGFRATRLLEINLENPRRERRLFDATAHSAAWSPDGTQLLFCRGGEVLSRKGYKGPRASRIWMHNVRDGGFELKLAEETEVRSPRWHKDGGGFYYVSSKCGTANLWSLRNDGGEPVQLTAFDDDGIVHPRVSADGSVFVMRRGFDIYRFDPESGKEPTQLEIWTRAKLPDHSTVEQRSRGAVHADFTPDLKQVVFNSLSEIWWLKNRRSEAVRLTETSAVESEVQFSQDAEWLYFLRDDGLRANYFRARLDNGVLVDEQQVTRGPRTKNRFAISPDGRIAWVEGTGDVFTANATGGEVKRVFESWNRPTFDWSPCGKWIVLGAIDEQSNRDIWVVSADGSRKPVNLTRLPAFEGSPKWSPDGRWIVFNGRRDTSGKLELWRIDLGKDGLKPDVSEARLHLLGDHAKSISTRGIEPMRVIWAADSKSILFQSTNATNNRLYSVPVTGSGMREVAAERGIPIRMTTDGDLLWRVNRTPAVRRGDEQEEFPISILVKRARKDLLEIGFRRAWRMIGERFYDPEMNGRDWREIRKRYEPMAVQAQDSRQFDRVMSQMLGELNASHLAFVHKVWPKEEIRLRTNDTTAHPGLIFSDDEKKGPLVIKRVVAGSPVSKLEQTPQAGEVVLRIAGKKVNNEMPLHEFFNGAENSPLPLVLRGIDGKERTLELRCISYDVARLLDRKAHEEACRNKANHGSRIAYLPFAKMNLEAFLDLEIAIYRAYAESDGMILDLRNNGGGRVADHLLAVFCQPVHSFTIPRDGPRGYPHDRRIRVAWDKPMVVLCNENTYSNAEIFCHAIKQTKRGPLVGVTTAGGVISAVSESIADVGRLQVPFRGWYHAQNGLDMDMNGAVPDHQVPMTPADEISGNDPQMEKALEIIRREISTLPPLIEPVK